VHNDRSLGLLAVVVDEGPISAIELLDAADVCESDLHGTVTELRAAGLLDEADVAGRRGYEATEIAIAALDLLRGGTTPEDTTPNEGDPDAPDDGALDADR
jgi:predicted transcriptional regulator